MPTGKPDFNLNSYGVKYLSKEEVQEFLEKRQGESISSIDEKNSKIESGSTTPSSNIINTSRRGIGSKQVMNPHGQTVPKKMQGKGRNLTGTSQLKETTPRKFEPSEAGKKQIDATINTPKQPEPKGVDTKDTQFHYNESKPVSGEGMVREGASARGNLQTPTYSSMYDSIAAACACLISSLVLGIPPISFSVGDSLFHILSGRFMLKPL